MHEGIDMQGDTDPAHQRLHYAANASPGGPVMGELDVARESVQHDGLFYARSSRSKQASADPEPNSPRPPNTATACTPFITGKTSQHFCHDLHHKRTWACNLGLLLFRAARFLDLGSVGAPRVPHLAKAEERVRDAS